MEIQEPVVKYSSYTEAQKKATQKYRQNNRDKVNEQRKKYYNIRKNIDPEFLIYKKEKAKEYYLRKKGGVNVDVKHVQILEAIKEAENEQDVNIISDVTKIQPEVKLKPTKKEKKITKEV